MAVELQQRSGEIRTGLFVLVALVILVVTSLWLAGADGLGGGRTLYAVQIDDAGGVRSGDPVRLAGVQVGQIEAVDLRPGEEWPVVLRVSVDASLPMNEGASAYLASDGLLGSRFLALETGPKDADSLAPGGVIQGRGGGGIDAAMARLAELSESAAPLLEDTTVLVRELGPRLTALLERAEAVLSEDSLAEVRETLRVVRTSVESLGPEVTALGARLDSVLVRAEAGLEPLPGTVEEAGALAADLRMALGPEGERLADVLTSATAALEGVQGAVGVVEGNAGDLEATLRDLRRAAANLEALSKTLKERPDRLIRPSKRQDRRPGEGVE